MKYRKLRDLEVSAVGYGAMGLSHGYGEIPKKDVSISLIQYAYEQGCTHFDTAEVYGAGDNELLLGEAIKPFRNKIVLATKFTLPDKPGGNTPNYVDKTIREHLENSMKRLGTDNVDLYYWHRINKNIPMAEVAHVMGELIKEGKIRGWGQSQSTADEIREGHKITPLTAIQSEYSIMERTFEKDVIPTCEELGIGFVPFSPLASGFLSGRVSKDDTYSGDDVRRVITRFDKENIEANQPLLELLHSFAKSKNASPAQISLTWMLHKKDFISPIPGSRKPERIKENLGAADVELSDEEFRQIENELEKITVYGNRTDEDIAKLKELK